MYYVPCQYLLLMKERRVFEKHYKLYQRLAENCRLLLRVDPYLYAVDQSV